MTSPHLSYATWSLPSSLAAAALPTQPSASLPLPLNLPSLCCPALPCAAQSIPGPPSAPHVKHSPCCFSKPRGPTLGPPQVKNSVGEDVREGVVIDPGEKHDLDNSRGTANFRLKWDRSAKHQVGAAHTQQESRGW